MDLIDLAQDPKRRYLLTKLHCVTSPEDGECSFGFGAYLPNYTASSQKTVSLTV
jgi:hypothetical protein